MAASACWPPLPHSATSRMPTEGRVMKIPRLRLSQRLAHLRDDSRGVSSVEFAMLLPLMITLYLGAVEISQGVGIDRKVTLTTRTVADLASQVSTISDTDMTNLLAASSSVIS